jgi:competence protein ComEC
MRLRPLPRAVIALAAGIIGAIRFPLPGALLFLAASAITMLALVSERWRPRLLLAGCAIAGAVLGQHAAGTARGDCRALLPDNTALEANGILTALPPLPAGGAGALRLEEVRAGRRGRERCAGEVRIRVRANRIRQLEPRVGAAVRVWGRWQANPPDPTWPRNPERAGTLLVDSLRILAEPAPRNQPLLALRASIQERFQLIFPRRGALAEAMILARKEGIDTEQRDRFARAGLAHLLAISGLHVGLIAGALLLLGGILRLSPRATAATTVCATIAYVLFLGAPHAATRAALQVTLALAGRIWQRPADPFSLIATAALVILLHDPLAILDPGFQLSFAGTAGIIALRRRFLAVLPLRLARPIRESVAVSIAATLATAPFTVIHFGQIAPIGVVANLIAIPVTGVAVPAIVVALGASFFSISFARFLGGAADLLLTILDGIAKSAAAVPGGQLLIPHDAIYGWGLAALLGALLAGRLAGGGREVRPLIRRAVAAATILALLSAWPLAARRLHDGRLEIHAIDVGQGDALAIRTPGGRWILVDAGPGGLGYDAGRARVVPFLLRHGARRVDALILTHPDSDHIGGAGAVLDAFEVGLVIDPGVAVGKSLYRELLHRANRGRLRWIAARADNEIRIDDVVIQLLQPDPAELDESRTTNELSVAFRLEYGRFGALFLGDATAAIEEELAARHGEALRSDLLKVAHHGSTTSTAEVMLDAARPRVAVISVGRQNRFGHPARQVLDRLERREIEVLRTDLAGTITIRVGPDGAMELVTQR